VYYLSCGSTNQDDFGKVIIFGIHCRNNELELDSCGKL
jgi:hypothetical protein